jgi:sensor histidine kinase YesM
MAMDTATLRTCVNRYWVRLAVVIVAVAALTTVIFGRGSVVISMIHGVVYSVCIGVLAGKTLPVVRHRVRDRGPVLEWIATLIAIFAVAIAGNLIACVILGWLGFGFGQPLARRFVASLQLNALLTLIIGVTVTLYESQRARVDALTLELRTKELERERDRKTALEAQLASLESRLHPHFLFNTLNAISELIHQNPERAERMVERLAALLRAALDATGQGLVPLARELEIVGDYLEIERARFGERLRYDVSVTPDARGCAVLPLAVQTLVENSIKHAIAPNPEGGRLRVEAGTTNGRLTVGVWDDGPGFEMSAALPGHGLENLQSRLLARFGDAAALSVARRDGGTLVTLALPRTASA